MNRWNDHGLSLTEIILATALASVLMIVVVRAFYGYNAYFSRSKVLQELNRESRLSMETISQALRRGKAGTAVISTPAVSPIVPNSRIDFQTTAPLPNGTTAYTFYWTNGDIQMYEFNPARTDPLSPRVLTHHAESLIFGTDSQDPGQIYVSIKMKMAWDASGNPAHVLRLFMPNQLVAMDDGP